MNNHNSTQLLAYLKGVKYTRETDGNCITWFVMSSIRLSLQGLLMKIKKKIARSFNFTFHYIDDVLSLNNSRFGDLLITLIPLRLK